MFIDSYLPGTLNLPEISWVKYPIWPLQSNRFHKVAQLRGWTVISKQGEEAPSRALDHKAVWYAFNLWALGLVCSGIGRVAFCHFLRPGMKSSGRLWVEKGVQLMVAE